MILQPRQQLQVATRANATGIMVQTAHVNTDTYSTLLAATGLEKEGLFYERNTGNLINAPSPLWEDLTLGDWTTTGGKWKEVLDRAVKVKSLSQYDATADVEWTATSPANF